MSEVREVVKPIVLTDTTNGDKFTLEFNRESVRFAEMKGFKIDDVSEKPMTALPMLFYFAFRMHHKALPKDKVDKLFEEMGGLTEAMIERLGQLYAMPFNSLIQDEEELKNSKVTVEL